MTRATQEATLTRRYRNNAVADPRGAMILIRLLGARGRPQFLAQLKARPVPPGGTISVRVAHESARCNVLTEGFACTCRHPIVVIEAIHLPGKESPMSEESMSPLPDPKATAIGRARAHALGLMGNIIALARLTPDTDVEGLKIIRDTLHRAVQVALAVYPDVAMQALEHAMPPERVVRDASRRITGYDLGTDGWALEVGAEKLGQWLYAHGNEPRSRPDGGGAHRTEPPVPDTPSPERPSPGSEPSTLVLTLRTLIIGCLGLTRVMTEPVTTAAERLKLRALHGVVYGAIIRCYDPARVVALRHEVCAAMALDIARASDDQITEVMQRVLLLLDADPRLDHDLPKTKGDA